VPAAPVPASAPAAPASPALPSRDAAGPPPISDGERAVLLDLRQRRQELDTRDAALSVRESILAAAEQKLQARVEELGALQKKLQDLEAARQQREEAGWQGLVKVYETMKPRDAAVIFNDLQMTVLLPLVDRMKDSKAAPVLAAMNPDKAREVTTGLAQMRTHPATANTSAQKGG
jgi:flagellar motility protein MotE (MotC chaperone)